MIFLCVFRGSDIKFMEKMIFGVSGKLLLRKLEIYFCKLFDEEWVDVRRLSLVFL